MGPPLAAPLSPASSVASSMTARPSRSVEVSGAAATSTPRPAYPRQRSRGQLARHQSTTAGRLGLAADQGPSRLPDTGRSLRGSLPRDDDVASAQATGGKRHRARQETFLGGLYFTDLIFIAFTYALNLLRTCGVAELVDVLLKGMVYSFTSLPRDFYARWSRSASRSSYKRTAQVKRAPAETTSSDVLAPEAKAEAEESQELSASPSQLSPFHHLVVLLVRFTCSNFPHLLPRVLFAEETIGPFVYWRTGGGSGSMVQAFSDLDDEPARERKPDAVPGFRAFWLSKDARVPVAEQRANLGARSASTLLYLHGGGFSLGSVAFYAESLLRLRAKVSALETERGVPIESDARFVAVEYDLAPTARFPTPLLQCLRCYAHLVEVEQIDPSCITLAGDSAGGNLTMAMLLALSGQAGDDGLLAERDWSALPMPGKAVLISPWVDLRPSHAAAFGPLRQPAKPRAEASTEKNEAASSSSPLDDYEWDYVAAEALLHFAQVYSGVLPRPRRVAGPLGWLADFCGGAGQEAEGNSEKKGSTARSGTFATPVTLEALARPGRRLARATHRVLAEPLFSQPPSTSSSNNDGPLVAQDQNSSFGGLEPLFPHSERQTDLVSSTSDLYVPIDGSASGDEDVAEAKQLLETHPLLSPSTGNWGAVRLERGMLVTWGERERLAVDIERFVERVHKLASSNNRHAAPRHDDGPAQDGDTAHASSMPEPDARAAWLQTYVESGPGGVHAWPFVNMYLAAEEAQRERGLDMLAEFIARSGSELRSPSALTAAVLSSRDPPHAAPDSAPHSPGSMPSDIEVRGGFDDVSDTTDTTDDSENTGIASRRTLESLIEASGGDPASQFGLGLGLDPPADLDSGSPSPVLSPHPDAGSEPWSSSDESSVPATPRAASARMPSASPDSFRSVTLLRPGQVRQPIVTPEPVAVSTRGRNPQPGAPLWWSAREDEVVPANVEQSERLDDIEEASNETFSPTESLSPPPEPEDQAVYQPVPPVPIDPSYYGLTQYAYRRPEPEGLSDITEEESVLSASLASLSGGDGELSLSLSRSRSPPGPSVEMSPESTQRRDAEWQRLVSRAAQQQAEYGAVEDDDSHEFDESVLSVDADESLAWANLGSPPSGAQPGPSLPIVPEAAWRSSDELAARPSSRSPGPAADDSSARSSLDSQGARKKPKGDVWW